MLPNVEFLSICMRIDLEMLVMSALSLPGQITAVMVFLLLAVILLNVVDGNENGEGQCKYKSGMKTRPHSVTITEFGAVGDGVTLNTVALQNAIYYLRSFADKGGAQLFVPKGRWLTGSFNLTSHLTLFLEKDAVILGSQVWRRTTAEINVEIWLLWEKWRLLLARVILQVDEVVALTFGDKRATNYVRV